MAMDKQEMQRAAQEITPRDRMAIEMDNASREARLATRIVKLSRGREAGWHRHTQRRDALVAKLRKRLIAMVERHDRNAVGGYRA
jgi:hypothetical protein